MATVHVVPTSNAAVLASAIIGEGLTLVGTPVLSGDVDGNACGTISNLRNGLGVGGYGAGCDFVFPAGQNVDQFGMPDLETGVIVTNGLAASAETATGASASDTTSYDHPPTGPSGLIDPDSIGHEGDDVTLTLQFVPQRALLRIPYVFGSEEYTEYIGLFNDSAEIRLNGVNIAKIPETNDSISVDNVYPGFVLDAEGRNACYWRDRQDLQPLHGDLRGGIAYDGLVFCNLIVPVTPGATYTLEIEVADAIDGLLDTAMIVGIMTSISYDPGVLRGMLPLVSDAYILSLDQGLPIACAPATLTRGVLSLPGGCAPATLTQEL